MHATDESLDTVSVVPPTPVSKSESPTPSTPSTKNVTISQECLQAVVEVGNDVGDVGPPLKKRAVYAPIHHENTSGVAAAIQADTAAVENQPELRVTSPPHSPKTHPCRREATTSLAVRETFTPRCLHVVNLNLDVQHEIMKLLPNSALASLMATCRHFSEVAMVPLCRRSGKPIRTLVQLLSFIAFLRWKSSCPRWPYVEEINISADLGDRGLHLQHNTIMRALALCRNLKRVRLYKNIHLMQHGDYEWSFAQVISTLSSLEELCIAMPRDCFNVDFSSHWRQLLHPPLRVFTQYGSECTDPPRATEFKHFELLPARTLVELNLPYLRNWSIPPGTVFPCVQRLTICHPIPASRMLNLKPAFPSLQHLTLVDYPPIDLDAEADVYNAPSLGLKGWRDTYRDQWAQHPDAWPDLLSFSANHPTTGYLLAVPRHVPHLFLLFREYESSASTFDMLRTIVTDANPEFLDYEVLAGTSSFLMQNFGQVYSEFDLLHASPRLARCVLTLETPCFCQEHYYWDIHRQMLATLSEHLRRASLSHLLVKHRGDTSDATSREQGESHDGYISDIQGDLGISTATALAEASPTLRWIGVYAPPYPMRSWEIRRTPDEEGVQRTTLSAIGEDEGWKILVAEGMNESAQRATGVPWAHGTFSYSQLW